MMVGDYLRLDDDRKRGIAVQDAHSPDARAAYRRLASAGYTARLPTVRVSVTS
jgi:hypothetical protein